MTIIPRGGLIRVTTFTSSGTWTRDPKVNNILIKVFGGGSGGYPSGPSLTGGTSSFGGVCSASGGSPSAGGSGSGGDLNIQPRLCGPQGQSGDGSGGPSAFNLANWNHGGGLAIKTLLEAAIPTSVSVTVGGGGFTSGQGNYNGAAGRVEVWEFSY